MFAIGFIIAIFSYLVLGLGLLGHLDKNLLGNLLYLFLFLSIMAFFTETKIKLRKDKVSWIFLGLLVLSMLVNLIGVFGPELSFDALWYHLTLPKLYLTLGRVSFIPGGLFYYSASPQLGEMLYLAGLGTSLAFFPKLIHFLFGVGSSFLTYKLSREFTGPRISLGLALAVYSQLLVGWLSFSAYTDLIVLFYVLLGFWAIVKWKKEKKFTWLIESALFFGLGMSVKLTVMQLALGVAVALFFTRQKIKDILAFAAFTLIPLLPWLIRSFLDTGNPVYPYLTSWFFKAQSNGLDLRLWLLSRTPLNLLKSVWQLVFTKADILSPLLLITLPLFLIAVFKNKTKDWYQDFFKIVFLLGFIFWFLTPLNYNRFFLTLVPIYFLILARELPKKFFAVLGVVLVLSSVLNIGSRLMANSKFIPYILGRESERSFMKKNLNFSAGNFYDLDGQIGNITKGSQVMVDGIHNQYYLNINYSDITDVHSGDSFSYVLAGAGAQKKYNYLPLVYKNRISEVSLYKAKITF